MASLRVKAVGGLQWAITGAYLFLLGVLAVAWYVRATRTAISLDLSRAFAVAVLAAFVAGYLWVGSRSPADGTHDARDASDAQDAHDRRIEVVVTMLVLGFVLPFGVPGLLDVLGVELGVPLAGFGAAYALTLALSYGLVYGLGFRFFLGPGRTDAPEFRE